MRELESLLPDLEPPAGGLARLRRRVGAVDTRQRRARTAWRWGAALALPALALALPALALALLLPAPIRQWQRTQALTQAMRQVLHPALPADGLDAGDAAVLPLSSGQANARLYLVQPTRPPAPPAGERNPR